MEVCGTGRKAMQDEQSVCFGALATGLCASGCILEVHIEDVQLPARRAKCSCIFTENSILGQSAC